MDENQKLQVLAQETSRRMLNTSEGVDMPTRLSILDSFARKMITSGYSVRVHETSMKCMGLHASTLKCVIILRVQVDSMSA